MKDQLAVEALDIEDRDRFIMVYEDVWQALKGKSELFVYMALKRRVNADNRQWYGTKKALAEEAGVSDKTFQRGIEKLEEIGLVVRKQRWAPKGWDGKNLDELSYSGRSEETPRQLGNLYQIRFHLPLNLEGRGKSDLGGGGKSDLGGGGKSDPLTEDTKNINTKDIETSGSPNGELDKPADRFDEFWNLYPRKTGSKPKLRTKFRELAKEHGAETLITGARFFAEECAYKQTEQMFIAHPSTWLNQKRWAGYQHSQIRKQQQAQRQQQGSRFAGMSMAEISALAKEQASA